MFSLFLINYRVKRPITFAPNIPFASGEHFKQKIATSSRSKPLIAIFQDTDMPIEFLNFPVEEFYDNFTFVRSSDEIGRKYQCITYPCVRAFFGESLYQRDTLNLIGEPGSLYIWLKNILDGVQDDEIVYEEDLRILLESETDLIFGVDVLNPPNNLNNYVIKYVSSKLMQKFNISLNKGYYLYLHSSRRILPYENKVIKSKLIDPRVDDITKKKFFACYIVDVMNDDLSLKEVEILETLADKYTEFGFSALAGKNAQKFLSLGRIESLDVPLFAVFESDSLDKGRWLLLGDKIHDISRVQEFLNGISDGSTPHTVLSEEIPVYKEGESFKKIVGKNFDENVLSDTYNTFVVFISPEDRACKRLLVVINEVAKLLEDIKDLKLMYIDATINDYGSYVPDYDEYPGLFAWKKGEKTAIKYKGRRTIPGFVSFLSKTFDFAAPVYNVTELESKMAPQLDEIDKNHTSDDEDETFVNQEDTVTIEELQKELDAFDEEAFENAISELEQNTSEIIREFKEKNSRR